MSVETVIAGVIAFGATFAGVFVSFRLERRRKEAEERNQFGRMVQGMYFESAVNHGLLESIKKWGAAGDAAPVEIRTENLQAAFSNPLFQRLAEPRLLMITTNVQTQLAGLSVLLRGRHLQAVTTRSPISRRDARELQILAEHGQEVLRVFEELLNKTLDMFGVDFGMDERTQEVRARIGEIVRRRNEQLAQLDAETGGDAEKGDSDA